MQPLKPNNPSSSDHDTGVIFIMQHHPTVIRSTSTADDNVISSEFEPASVLDGFQTYRHKKRCHLFRWHLLKKLIHQLKYDITFTSLSELFLVASELDAISSTDAAIPVIEALTSSLDAAFSCDMALSD